MPILLESDGKQRIEANMKFLSSILMLFVWIRLAHGGLFDKPHVTVYGVGKVDVAPNIMQWEIEVRLTGPVLEDVVKAQAESTQRVIQIVLDSGVQETEIQMKRMMFGEEWDRERGRDAKEFKGHHASSTVSFTSADLKGYDALWLSFSRIRGCTIRNVVYSHTDSDSIRAVSRIAALDDARKRAGEMATRLGAHATKVLYMEQGHNPVPTRNNSDVAMWAMSASSSDNPVIGGPSVLPTGKIRITEQVTVVFELEE